MRNFNRKTNYPLLVGGLAYFICFGIGHFIDLPSIVSGFLVGIGIAGFVFGLYTRNHDISKIQNWKRNLLHSGR